jgi:DNA-binding MarR family transcriptional regulator
MEHIHRLIHDIYILLDSRDTQVFSQFDLTPTQYRALILLSGVEGKSLTTLADQLLRNRSTATRLIDQLERRELVRRDDEPNDRRIHCIFLTQKGIELRDIAHKAHLDSLEARFANLSLATSNQLDHLLSKLRDSLEADLNQVTLA